MGVNTYCIYSFELMIFIGCLGIIFDAIQALSCSSLGKSALLQYSWHFDESDGFQYLASQAVNFSYIDTQQRVTAHLWSCVVAEFVRRSVWPLS